MTDGPVWAGAQTQAAVFLTLKTDKQNKRFGTSLATPGASPLKKQVKQVRGQRMTSFKAVVTRRALHSPGSKP